MSPLYIVPFHLHEMLIGVCHIARCEDVLARPLSYETVSYKHVIKLR